MPSMEKDVDQQRVKFVVRAVSGKEEMAALCREFGVSRPTGYVWRKRFQQAGSVAGVVERSRRSRHSAEHTQRQRGAAAEPGRLSELGRTAMVRERGVGGAVGSRGKRRVAVVGQLSAHVRTGSGSSARPYATAGEAARSRRVAAVALRAPDATRRHHKTGRPDVKDVLIHGVKDVVIQNSSATPVRARR
jgi:transposase-like protein